MAFLTSAVIAYAMTGRWCRHWGASPDEVNTALPGDDLLENPTLVTTRAVTIDAPVTDVWPWLVQMGQDRGGLYSYDWLERLFGLQFHNADRIVPEWQRLVVGDQIRMAPAKAGPEAGFTVTSLESCQHIVTAVGDPARVLSAVTSGPLPDGGTWVFVLRAIDDHTTRLIVRMRASFALAAVPGWVCARLLEPVHFVMERKQLLGIKLRAERGVSITKGTGFE